MIEKLIWKHDRMLLDDLVFRIEHNKNDDWELGEDCFKFYKVKDLVDRYVEAFSNKYNFHPQNVFELGIWDGGSIAFWFEYFRPHKHVAIDFLDKQDSPYFKHYIGSRGLEARIKTYWDTDQADTTKLREIVAAEFNGPLDLVIDDASHLYGPTKTSFETLFPLLRPGGLYVIEDWNWAYLKEYQVPDHPWAKETPLAKLVFELIEATGTLSLLIRNLYVTQNFVIVERGKQDLGSIEFKLKNFITKRAETTLTGIETSISRSDRAVRHEPVYSPKKPGVQVDSNMSRLAKIIEQIPADASPKELFGDVDDEFWFWLHTEGYRNSSKLRDILPGLPEDQIQLDFTGQTGDDNLASGFKAYKLFKQIALDNLEGGHQLDTVLDFGCGWGRIIRFFQKDIEPANLWGADPLNFAAHVFKRTNSDRWSNFVRNNLLPPISFDDDTFDLIYLNSVFSHLSEESHRQWLTEFSRILKPGGLLIATTWGEDFIHHCADQREKPPYERTPYEATLAESFIDTIQALLDFKQGKFLFAPSVRTDDRENYGKYYGNTCIPKGYVLAQWTKHFEFIDFIDDRNRYPQNVIIVKKDKSAS